MAVGFSNTNKPLNPRGQDASPKGYNRAKLYSGKALDFDGVNDYVTTDNISIQSSNTWAIVSNIYIDNATGVGYFFDARENSFDGYGIYMYNSGLTNYFDNNGGHLLTHTFPINQYFNIAVIRNGSDVSFYENGVFVETITSSATYSVSGDFHIGQRFSNSDFLKMKMGGFKAFDVALTAAQVADLYNNPEKVVPTGVDNTALKLWLPMQEGAGTTAYDGSGNGNHGTISGATYVNGVGAPVSQTAVIDWNKGTNLLQYSEDFVTGFSISNAVVSQANITAPDGSNLVRKLVATNANTFHLTLQGVTQSAGIYTQSVYAKAEGRDFLYMNTRVDGGSNRYGVKFNIANGTYVDDATSGSPTNTSYSIQNMGNGWFRCSISIQHTSGSVVSVFSPAIAGAVNGINDGHQGDGVNGIYIWGGALSQSTIPQPYVYTGATAQPNPVLLPAGLTTGRDITGVNLFENVRKQGALNLDGNSWAEVHDNESIDLSDANASFEAWVYYDFTAATNHYIFNKLVSSGYRIRIEPGGNFGFYMSDGNYAFSDGGSFPLVANSWNHLVLTTDGTNFKRYINGSLADTDVNANPLTNYSNTDNLYIGSNQTPADYMPTQLAQPRIYNRALTAAEVLQNYNSGKNTYK